MFHFLFCFLIVWRSYAYTITKASPSCCFPASVHFVSCRIQARSQNYVSLFFLFCYFCMSFCLSSVILKSSYYCTNIKLVYLYFVKSPALIVESDRFCPSFVSRSFSSYISVLASIPVTSCQCTCDLESLLYHACWVMYHASAWQTPKWSETRRTHQNGDRRCGCRAI